MIQFECRQMHCNVRLTASTPDLSYAATKERKWGMTNRRKILKARSCSARSTPVIELESTFFGLKMPERAGSRVKYEYKSRVKKIRQINEPVIDSARGGREGPREGEHSRDIQVYRPWRAFVGVVYPPPLTPTVQFPSTRERLRTNARKLFGRTLSRDRR